MELSHLCRMPSLPRFFLFLSVVAAQALNEGNKVFPSLSSPGPASTTLSWLGAASTATAASTSSSSPNLHRQSRSTGDPELFSLNATMPEGQLPLLPKVNPGWAVAGTILLGAGVVHALAGIRTERVQTFFSTAFLASLATTVLILYLMTPPITSAVHGAFVVAAVCTGAALGGLAVLFRDLAECLGCLLGGFSLAMWLLTLHPGGLVPNQGAKVAFIAAFTVAGFGLYCSRWTRTYGLMACIAFSGSTAAVLGIDCFSRAGLKEFWAYIWALNDKLFPDGTTTYPLTRGIRVELAVTVLFSVVSVISQLKLWRLIQDRRSNSNTKEPRDEEQGLPDDEENIGRQVEEMTSRERREWERTYGNGRSVRSGSPGSTSGGMENEKSGHGSKRTSATSTTEVQCSVELPSDTPLPREPEETPDGLAILEKNAGDGRVTVRVVEEDTKNGNTGPQGASQETGHENPPANFASPSSSCGSASASAPPIVPLPFKIPVARPENDGISVALSADGEDDSSVAAIADEEADVPRDPMACNDTAEDHAAPRNQANLRHSHPYLHSGLNQEKGSRGVVSEIDQPFSDSLKKTASAVATLDGGSNHGDADTAILDWSLEEGEGSARRTTTNAAKQDAATAQHLKTSEPEPLGARSNEPAHTGPQSPVLDDRPTARASHLDGVSTDISGDSKLEEVVISTRDEAPRSNEARSVKGGAESTAPLQTAVARLTRGNLPPALPGVALTYRTNEWAKHLSIAEVPEPDVLLAPEPLSDAPDEEPAHLDIIDLQQTAEAGAPPPVVPRPASAMSIYDAQHATTNLRASLLGHSGVAPATPAWSSSPDLQSTSRSGHSRPAPWLLNRPALALPESITEEGGGQSRTRQRIDAASQGLAHHGFSVSVHATNHATNHAPAPAPAAAYAKPQTLIGMREMLLRSRASGILSPNRSDTVHTAPDPRRSSSEAEIPISYPARQASPDVGSHSRSSSGTDLDDVPLSQRRALILQTAAATVTAAATPAPTADTAAFDSHQPARHSNVLPESARQAQLANFRRSVAADLGATSPPLPSPSSLRRVSSSSATMLASTSMPSLHLPAAAIKAVPGTTVAAGNNHNPHHNPNTNYNNTTTAMASSVIPHGGSYVEPPTDVVRDIERQRSMLLWQRDAEAQRRVVALAERERHQREFEVRMRSGELLGAHREAMRRLQGVAKPA